MWDCTGCRNTLVLFKLTDILWNHKFLSENSGVGLHTVYCLNELCLPHSGGNILFFVMSIRHKSLYIQLLHIKRESLTTLHTWLLITEWRSTNYTSFLKGVIALWPRIFIKMLHFKRELIKKHCMLAYYCMENCISLRQFSHTVFFKGLFASEYAIKKTESAFVRETLTF